MSGAAVDLFSPAGHDALARLASRPAIYAFDFDGTLAPIVERPDDAGASAATVAALSSLGARVPVALLTGRGVDDLRRRIAFTPRYLVGNHGAEGLPGSPDPAASGDADEHRAVVRRWLAQWPAAVAATGGDDAGVEVEAKSFSLSIHYRRARDHAAACRTIERAMAALDPAPRVIGGKCVFNVLPDGAPDKGQALRALVRHERCDGAFFIGDDVTDEVAFQDAPASWVTVRVGRSDDSAARFYIERQDEIDRCLALLLAVVGVPARSA